jgi:hypothetical protein
MKKGVALLLAIAATAFGQGATVENGRLIYKYDLDSTDLIYCTSNGQTGSPWGAPIQGQGAVTAANDPTLTCDSSTSCFTGLAANDVITINGTTYQVLSVTSVNSIELDSSATITSARQWSWTDTTCGTTASSGWFDVSGYTGLLIVYEVVQMETGTITISPECRQAAGGSSDYIVTDDGAVDTTTAAATGYYSVVLSEAPFSQCRVGFKIDADDSDAGANLEQINVSISKYLQK